MIGRLRKSMKSKRFLALVFAAVMMLTAVMSTGCAKGDNSDQNELSGIVTLNMFVITEEETSQTAAKEVQMAINEITVPQYKMLVKMNYLTAEEYWDAVDSAEAETLKYTEEKKTAANEKKETSAEEVAEGEETAEEAPKSIDKMTFNEAIDYVFDIEDVELLNPQIDVLVVDDYDKFLELVEDERISEIDIKYDRKVVTKYIHPTILSTTSVNKKTYGIPTNFAINGEYEFLVYNKNLLDKYGYTVHDLRNIEDMGEYLALIKRNEPGVYPISDIPELSGAEIYNNILFSRSALDEVSGSSHPVYVSNVAYMNYLNAIGDYRKNGYVASYNGVSNAAYAIEYVKSTELIDREWTENGVTYQAYLYDIPRVTAREAFKSAMCVSAYSLNKAKAAELIELFTIDAKLANLLQYGIEGKHYRVQDDIVTYIESEEDTYRMNNLLTGNVYIKYTTAEEADYIEKAKASNLGTAPSTFFGYIPSFSDVASQSIFECVEVFSKTALEMMESGEMTVDEVFNIAGKQLNALGCVWNESGSALLGVFGKISNEQQATAAQHVKSFIISDEVSTYNDVYKSASEIAAELEAEAAKKAEEEAARLAAEEAALAARIEAQNKADEALENPVEELPEETPEA